jgi:hypothetical protein
MRTELEQLADAVWGFVSYMQPADTKRMQRLRAQDLADLQQTPGLDPNAVGELLGTGMQHRIYEYVQAGMPMVLKIATPIPGLRFPTAGEAEQDIALLRRFFAGMLVEPTDVVRLPSAGYVIKQLRLANFHPLTAADLAVPEVRGQFLDLVQRNSHMLAEVGRSLDFLGREGQRKCRAALFGFKATPTIANLVVQELAGGNKICILDTDLENLRPGAVGLRDRQSALAARLAIEINRFLIQHFFGIDILAPRF